MPKKQTLELISDALRRGNIRNIELKGRLIRYKRREQALSEEYGTRVLGSKEASKYQAEAKRVGEAWIELVVDMASFYGEGLDKQYVKTLRETLFESIEESTNRFHVPEDPITQL